MHLMPSDSIPIICPSNLGLNRLGEGSPVSQNAFRQPKQLSMDPNFEYLCLHPLMIWVPE